MASTGKKDAQLWDMAEQSGIDHRLRVLFSPGERWGWEWRNEQDLYMPFTKPPPEERIEAVPSAPNEATVAYRRWKRLLWLFIPGIFVAIIVISVVVTAVEGKHKGILDVTGSFAIIALLIGGPIWLFLHTRTLRRRASNGVQSGGEAYKQKQHELASRHEAAVAAWRREADEYGKREKIRVSKLPLWGAIQPTLPSRRIDIFGGTREGWQGVTTTLGASMIGSGHKLFVLDLSEADISSLLFIVSAEAGVPTRVHVLPRDAEQFNVFAGLPPTAAKDLLVEALHPNRSDADMNETVVDDKILSELCDVLAPSLTIDRFHKALRVLLRESPRDDDDVPLTDVEWSKISELFNDEYRDVIRPNLVRLESQLSPLRTLGRSQTADGDTSDALCEGVALGRESGALLNQQLLNLLVQRTIFQLRLQPKGDTSRVLFVIAADLLNRQHIEKLDDLASTIGIRIVYIFRRLRDEILDVAGSNAAIAGIMRPNTPQEAEQAANFIGREYKFELAQKTRTEGSTWTTTWGESRSTGGMPMSSETAGVSRAEQWQRGTVDQRVHEYKVEPEILRTLPDTALMLVEFTPAGQAKSHGVRVANCDPTISADIRTSPLPFPEEIPAVASESGL